MEDKFGLVLLEMYIILQNYFSNLFLKCIRIAYECWLGFFFFLFFCSMHSQCCLCTCNVLYNLTFHQCKPKPFICCCEILKKSDINTWHNLRLNPFLTCFHTRHEYLLPIFVLCLAWKKIGFRNFAKVMRLNHHNFCVWRFIPGS